MGVLLIAALALGSSGLTYEAVCKHPKGEWHKVAGVDSKHDADGIHLLFQRDVAVVPDKRWYEWVDKDGLVGPREAAYLCFDEDPVNVCLYAAKDWMNFRYRDVNAFRAWQGRQAEEARKAMTQAKASGVNYGWSGWSAGTRHSAGSGPATPNTLVGQSCPPGPRDGPNAAPANPDQLWIGGGVLVCALVLVLYLKRIGRI